MFPAMPLEANINYGIGLDERHVTQAAQLYDEAFGEKFRVAVKSRAARTDLWASGFIGRFAISACAGDELVGVAGFHTDSGSLTGGIGASQLLGRLGTLRGIWAMAVFSLYERTPKPGELVMDGIAVEENFRGRGIGSQLLAGIVNYARNNGFKTVRLDVIDDNPGARQLYKRNGFVAVRSEKFPYLRWLLGFGGATTMELRVADAASAMNSDA